MKADWEKYLKFRCTGCGNCCRNTVVCITDADIMRIVDGTGKAPADFVRFYNHDQIAVSRDDPLWVSFASGRGIMGLRAGHNRCGFLDNATNRCTIYEHRPLTCRDHPFSINFSTNGAIEKLWLSRIVPCPHEWDGKISRRELTRIATWNERQEDAYIKRVRIWNRQKQGSKTRPAFLRYLGFEV